MPPPPMSMPGISSASTGEADSNRQRIGIFMATDSTRRSAEQVHQLGEFDSRFLDIAALDRGSDAMIGMGLQKLIFDFAQGGLDGLDLRQDVDAIAIIFDHADNAADLALDAGEPLDQFWIVLWHFIPLWVIKEESAPAASESSKWIIPPVLIIWPALPAM